MLLVENLVLPSLNQALINNIRKTTPRWDTTSQPYLPHSVLRTGLNQHSVGKARAHPRQVSPQPDCSWLTKQAFGKWRSHLSATKASPKVLLLALLSTLSPSPTFPAMPVSMALAQAEAQLHWIFHACHLWASFISRHSGAWKDGSWWRQNKRLSQNRWSKNWTHK